MKEIHIRCPECKYVTIYHRDNTFFYARLLLLLGLSFVIGFIVRNMI